MNILVISFLAVVSLTTFPTQTYCTPAASSSGTHDPKKSVAAAEAAQPVNDNGLKEIWQEDDREVLIRNERGTKNGGSAAAGKKNHKKEKLSPYSSHQRHQEQQQQQQQQQQQKQEQQLGTGSRKGQKKVKPTDATRTEPAANSQCRYTKGPWTECDATTNKRSRTLSLKKGESSCVQTRTIEKKCKKACRYDKGAWSDCDTNGQMSRTDSLKQSSDTTCQTTRVVNKNCNQGKSKDKQNKPPKAEKKEKGVRKNRQ
ncbi:protein naked cuticle-like [Anopheles marshallii]|uniref:protein naked cuticle-like n=1 Tax=Anopheles marshallii TaxID=1521116 RepID=UPI00237A4A5E|nr:protein naked cuticle-like [Anopheles marshallii]